MPNTTLLSRFTELINTVLILVAIMLLVVRILVASSFDLYLDIKPQYFFGFISIKN